MNRLLLTPLLALAALLGAAGGAHATAPEGIAAGVQAAGGERAAARFGVATAASSSRLWATVNVCDTAGAPNAMGVRASMPGDGTGRRMYMRFTAQWFSVLRQKWLPVGGKGLSRWIYAGRARYESRQAGYTFVFRAPAAGGTFLVRGLVDYQWRAKKRVRRRYRRGRRARRSVRWVIARRARRVTRADVTGVDGGDPPGQSQANCLIT